MLQSSPRRVYRVYILIRWQLDIKQNPKAENIEGNKSNIVI